MTSALHRAAVAFAVMAAFFVATPAFAQLNLNLDVNVGGIGVSLGTGTSSPPSGSDTSNAIPGAPGAAATASQGTAAATGPTQVIEQQLDQTATIEAIKAHRALPLEQVMAAARTQIDGEIVDAQLLSLNGFLLYELKVLGAKGDVDELYFYARSGERVPTN